MTVAEQLYAEIFLQPDPPKKQAVRPAAPATPISLSDQDIIAAAERCKEGPKIGALLRGDWEGRFPSQSEADQSLCNYLAFFSGGPGNEGTVDRIFRGSGLMRDKWDEKHYGDGRTYGDEVIRKAFAGRTEYYSPPMPAGQRKEPASARKNGSHSNGIMTVEAEEAFINSKLNEEEGDSEFEVAQWPKPLDEAAFRGLAGDVVRTIEPHTEADEAALLGQFLVAYGSAASHNTFVAVGAARHTTNTNLVLVGRSSKGRKGTSLEEIVRALTFADALWAREHIVSGLSSGEGLIFAVRDPVYKQEPVREGGKKQGPITEYQMVMTDPGVEDKRLLVVESEFASVLRVAGRDGNTLSAIIRQAWDNGNLRVLNKNSPLKATGAHISIIGHITKAELLKCLTDTDRQNGFANRFLWMASRRSKLLPEGGEIAYSELEELGENIKGAIRHAWDAGQPRRDTDAKKYWQEVYEELAREKDGMAGVVTSRAEAQVTRLSLIYALLDCSHCIRRPHIESALAVWRYCEASADWAFGAAVRDANSAKILEALAATEAGLTQTDIQKEVFKNNLSGTVLNVTLQALAGEGRIRSEETKSESGRGRPIVRWFLL